MNHAIIRSSVLILVIWATAWPAVVGSQAPPGGSAGRDISGFWELSFDSKNVPSANLLPTVTTASRSARLKADEHARRWCNLLGMPFLMDSGRPLDIRVGATAVILAPENASAPRYLYLNRTTHISDDIFDPSTNGDSIARWDGDALVVDTVGFHEQRGITTIPGGGYRTATSHLVERYRLVGNGNILSVTFTWTDPKVFRTPHTYEFRYYRLPANYEPRVWAPCNPYDEERNRFLDGAARTTTPPPPNGAKPAAPTSGNKPAPSPTTKPSR